MKKVTRIRTPRKIHPNNDWKQNIDKAFNSKAVVLALMLEYKMSILGYFAADKTNISKKNINHLNLQFFNTQNMFPKN